MFKLAEVENHIKHHLVSNHTHTQTQVNMCVFYLPSLSVGIMFPHTPLEKAQVPPVACVP